MSDLFEKGIFIGLGLLSVTKEQVEKVVDELIEKGKVSQKEGPKVLKDLLARADEEKKALEARIDSGLAKSLQRLNVPTRKDLEEVNKKLDQILKELKKGS